MSTKYESFIESEADGLDISVLAVVPTDQPYRGILQLVHGMSEYKERYLPFMEYMAKTVSVRDTFVRKPTKENFYHGLLLGILGYKEGWFVTSNREAGNGFSDIMIQIDDEDTGIIIEVKYAENGHEEQECQNALRQIAEQEYMVAFEQNGIHKILAYGIACNRKKCRVMMESFSLHIPN